MNRFENILVYTREHTTKDPALDRAVEIAIAHKAALTVVQVVEPIPGYAENLLPEGWDIQKIAKTKARENLEDLVRAARAAGVSVQIDILEGRPALEITRRVLRHHHDLVVKTGENEEGFLGTVASKLTRICPCPVWVVHPERPGPIRRILAAVDPAPESSRHDALQERILEVASSFSTADECELHVVHCWKEPGDNYLYGRMESTDLAIYRAGLLAEAEKRMGRLMGLSTVDVPANRIHLPESRPSDGIKTLAKKLRIDVLVFGTIARRGLAGFLLGNTAERVLRTAQCSVVSVKPEDFVAPVTA